MPFSFSRMVRRAWAPMCLMVVLGFTSGIHAARADTVAFQAPGTTTFGVGESFTLLLEGTGFMSTLDGGGIHLTFDPSVLRLVSVSVDTLTWEFFSDNGTIDNTLGRVDDVLFASFEERLGSFPIAAFHFETLAAGSTALMLYESATNPFASGGSLLPVDFGNLTVEVSAVPLPAALGLFAAGLGLLSGFSGRRRRAAMLTTPA